jgi:hypothetical protein
MTLNTRVVLLSGSEATLSDQASRVQHVFVVRIWQETSQSVPLQWRGSVEHMPSRQKLYFASMRDLNDFIMLRMGPAGSLNLHESE